MYLKETRWGEYGPIHLTQDRVQRRDLVNMVINLRVPQNSENFSISGAISTFLRRTLLLGADF
jgi:hypothetical protein